jgi:hypothetical protein
MNQAMNRDEFQKWVNAKIESVASEDSCNPSNGNYLRISNARYSRDADFEDRLTLEDKQMLTEMGIVI